MSSPPTPLSFVEDLIAEKLGFFEQRRRFNRKAALRFTVLPASLAALATLIIGAAQVFSQPWLHVVAMAATALVSVLAAWESLFSNRKLWVLNNMTIAQLTVLKVDVEYRKHAPSPVAQAEVDVFYGRYQQIIGDTEKRYESIVSPAA